MTDGSTSSPSFGQRMGAAFKTFLRALVRLLALVIFLLLIGLGVFYLIPIINQRYVKPVLTDIAQLQAAQTEQAQTNEQILARLEDIQQRISALEIRSDSSTQAIDELGASIESIPSTQQAYLASLESTQTATLARLNEINSALDDLDQKVARLSQAMAQANANIGALENQLEADDAPVAVLRRELVIVQAMELLTRSRLFIVENNLGLAEEDILAARNLMADMPVPDRQLEVRDDIIQRLDLAMENLPSSPVLAAEDLEIAWKLLKIGLPGEPPIPTSIETTPPETTPAPEGEPESTLTPSSTAQQTPTITNTP
ncbi:MAG: hypothetical protein JXA78_10760 [Anaerolineales bacterium]|nr:hypothetical protein [Anaerolineales bacterium]